MAAAKGCCEADTARAEVPADTSAGGGNAASGSTETQDGRGSGATDASPSADPEGVPILIEYCSALSAAVH